MKSFKSKKTELRSSCKQGKGFFAAEKILRGEVVAIRSGHIVEFEEAMRLDQFVGDFSLQLSDDHFLCPKTKEEVDNIAIYINHSCDPNVGMDGQISYVAMRDVQAGEELCLDYAMAMTTEYRMECKCGSEYCRGVVTGDDWMKRELQNKYGQYFATFILKKIHDEEGIITADHKPIKD